MHELGRETEKVTVAYFFPSFLNEAQFIVWKQEIVKVSDVTRKSCLIYKFYKHKIVCLKHTVKTKQLPVSARAILLRYKQQSGLSPIFALKTNIFSVALVGFSFMKDVHYKSESVNGRLPEWVIGWNKRTRSFRGCYPLKCTTFVGFECLVSLRPIRLFVFVVSALIWLLLRHLVWFLIGYVYVPREQGHIFAGLQYVFGVTIWNMNIRDIWVCSR